MSNYFTINELLRSISSKDPEELLKDLKHYFYGDEEKFETKNYVISLYYLTETPDELERLEKVFQDIPLIKDLEALDVIQVDFTVGPKASFEKDNRPTTKKDIYELVDILNHVIAVLKKRVEDETILVYLTYKNHKKRKLLYDKLVQKAYHYPHTKFEMVYPHDKGLIITLIIPNKLMRKP